ncbi:serine/threonine-protein kinase DCLK1-like isoform X2 [Mizuhopecten yessoensis]|uniref:Serine/threonine-protein kinase DCLK2 n=1 Tax=Mizuhopecten yessoensis TaxID=6573 RepID=A0A210QVW6_MIZYE|nr:serine/threonine-protein kinase DCLK1-like isoform X2 [Mizuhopecten yessoensis]OWF52900.1 Serine/threonine-protein kinase DCLK2 [Mizuhopecten yessoensis]
MRYGHAGNASRSRQNSKMIENGYEEHFAYSDDRVRNGRASSRSGRTSPAHSAHGSLIRHSLMKGTDDKRAMKVRFYRNGDKFFKGIVYAVSCERFRTLDSLLVDLTNSPVCDRNVLPNGVRHIFSTDGSHKVTNLDQLEEGESYVCASTELFKRLDYTKSASPNWNVNVRAKDDDSAISGTNRESLMEDMKDYIKPKLVTIVRNGSKPRKAVRVLLNRKTAHSFDQVMDDITEAIKLDSGAVRKVFTLDGKQVTNLYDFFQDDSVFIAYGPERFSADDFDLDDNEVRLVSPYKPSPFKEKRVTLRSAKSPRSSRKLSLSNRSLNEEYQESRSGRSSPLSSPHSSPRMSRKSSGRVVSAPKYRLQEGLDGESYAGPPSLGKKYEIGRTIGEGNFAIVMECIDRTTNKRYALKKIDKTRCKGKEQMIENEVSILRKVQHPNIIMLLEEFDAKDELYLVMEYVKGGDLFDAIAMATKYTEQDASGMVYNLSSALKYLHNLNIVHRDVKPENLLVFQHTDGAKSIKLGDFGLATYATEVLYTVCGTPTYVAPEILAEIGYGFKVDVWAAGVILYILLSGFPPFVSTSNDQEELFDQILDGKFEFTAPFWDDVSDSAKDLISQMLDVDPNSRLSAADVLVHPWVADDMAKNEDIHGNITTSIKKHFKRKSKPSLSTAGIRIVTSTALDKGSRFFPGRKAALTLQQQDNGDEVF